MLKLEINNETGTRVVKKPFAELVSKFDKVLNKVVKEKIGKQGGLIDLVFIDDETMKAMNGEYRKKNSPTDVLTFAYLEITDYEEDDGDIIVADIFISVDTAKRQAKEKKHSIKREMEILFVHGLLHAFGFDHNNDEEEAEMEGWAKKVLG